MQRDAHRVSKATRDAAKRRRTHDTLTGVPSSELRKGDSLRAPYVAYLQGDPRIEGDLVVLPVNGTEVTRPARFTWTVERAKVAS
jgi:hypothetical protein